jgi:hypothetical protein
MDRSSTLVTRLVDKHFHSDLGPLDRHLWEATRAAAAERGTCLERHAVLVIATWLDERARTHLRCWLRAAPAAGGPIAVSVGSHDCVDVGPIHGAALRHALIVLDPELRGDVLDVIDLVSHSGLRVDSTDGALRVQGKGAVRFGAGSADVLAIALEPGAGVDEALERMSTAQLLGRGSRRADRRPAMELAEELQWQGLARRCEVSTVGIADLPRQRTTPMRRPDAPRWPSLVGVTILSAAPIDEQHLRVTPTEHELRNGFLIGRYERCSVAAGVDDLSLSRVHAFVMGRRIHGKDTLLVADAGSTNGTWVIEGDQARELDRGHRATVARPGAWLQCSQTTIVEIAPAS